MDSEQFYESVLDFLDDLEEKGEVDDLLNWWNWWVFMHYIQVLWFVNANTCIHDSQVFLSYVVREHTVTKHSALAKLREKRALQQIQNAGASAFF